MGFLKPKSAFRQEAFGESAPLTADEIREQEKAKIKAENLASLKAQEEQRQTLRTRLAATEDDEGEIKRKRLFGQ